MISLLPDLLQQELSEKLGAPVFIGVPLSEREAGSVVARLDNAAAEASARLLGGRDKPTRKAPRARTAKRR